jgi:hypothetical protein
MQPEGEDLSARRQELISRASEQEIEWQPLIEGLPQDNDIVIIFALASLLDIDAWGALDPNKPLEDLDRERAVRQKEDELFEEMRVEEDSRRILSARFFST